MKRPSFQFYPADWRANAKLRRCTEAERGIWIDTICLLHDSEEYGVLRWPLKDIAQALGCKVQLLNGLREKGVLKGADVGQPFKGHIYTPRHAGKAGDAVFLIAEQSGPVWFSSRMVEDEYVRTKRATQGTQEATPKPPFGDGLGTPKGGHPSRDARAQSSSSSSENLKDIVRLAPDAGLSRERREAREAGKRAIEYLNEKAGTRYSATEANLKFPVDRILVDKATEADLVAVVDLKCRHASEGSFDRKYLRPETLWNATKFSGYIGQVGVRAPAEELRLAV